MVLSFLVKTENKREILKQFLRFSPSGCGEKYLCDNIIKKKVPEKIQYKKGGRKKCSHGSLL